MRNFAPAISMKRRTTRFAAAVMTSGALIAVGLGGASAPATASTETLVDVDCVQVALIGQIVCESLNHNTILTINNVLNGNTVNLSVLSDDLSNNELNVSNIANILSNNNVTCSTFALAVAGVITTGQCKK